VADRMKADHGHTLARGLPRQGYAIQLETRTPLLDTEQRFLAIDEKRRVPIEFASAAHIWKKMHSGGRGAPARMREDTIRQELVKSSADSQFEVTFESV